MHYAMVTGATGVLGAAFSKELAARGENLFLTGRVHAVSEPLLPLLRGRGGDRAGHRRFAGVYPGAGRRTSD